MCFLFTFYCPRASFIVLPPCFVDSAPIRSTCFPPVPRYPCFVFKPCVCLLCFTGLCLMYVCWMFCYSGLYRVYFVMSVPRSLRVGCMNLECYDYNPGFAQNKSRFTQH
ncbi:hypothetical protein MHYP_G00267630, partial [Metynnis hypsauchen]